MNDFDRNKEDMNAPTTIASLRKQNFKIRVLHCRKWNVPNNLVVPRTKHEIIDLVKPKNLGGMTVLELTTPDGRNFSAQSVCSDEDNYSRKTGINLCLLRLGAQGAF